MLSQLRSYVTPVPSLGLRQANSSRAQVIVSDISAKAETAKIHWGDGTSRTFACMQPLGRTNEIAFAVARLDSELHLTATFCERFVGLDVMESVIGPAFDGLLRQLGEPEQHDG